MKQRTLEQILQRLGPKEDPEDEARRVELMRKLLDTVPAVKQELIEQGKLIAAREALRQILAQRGLVLEPEQERRVDDCDDLGCMRRWRRQTITAASVDEALK